MLISYVKCKITLKTPLRLASNALQEFTLCSQPNGPA